MVDNPLSASKRAERLFDILKANDNNVDHKADNLESLSSDVNSNKNKKLKPNRIGTEKEVILKQETVLSRIEIVEDSKEISNSNKVLQHSEDSKYKGLLQEIDNQLSISELCAGLQKENSLAIRCQSALALAVFCRSPLSAEDCNCVFDALNIIPDHHDFSALSFCQALLLYVMTKQNITSEQIASLEKSILKVAHSVLHQDGIFGGVFLEARIVLLGGERYLTACKLCKEMFYATNLDINSLDVSALCCSALRSLSQLRNVSSGLSKFTDSTLIYILSMIGKSTQEIISENLIDLEDEEEVISIPSYTVNQCLQVLEQILSVDSSSPCKTLYHEDFSLLRCLTKLLEWSISTIFSEQISKGVSFKVQNPIHVFHLSTLVSILKVFSILSFDPDQYDCFTNVTGSMEKIMICILKIYFHSEGNHFDVLVLALELMINFSFKCKKTFALLCLKKFEIDNSQEVLAIEAFLKILKTSLNKISEVKARSLKKTTQNEKCQSQLGNNDATTEENDIDLVLKAADEDMELSTIVSFVCIILMLFIDTKKSFYEYVREKFSSEKCSEAVAVSNKFLQFALLTGGMPATGILLLKAAIKKLNELYPSS